MSRFTTSTTSKFSKFQCHCACGRTTTKAYARAHGNKCKACVTGVVPAPSKAPRGNEYGNDGYEQWNEEAGRIRLAESGQYDCGDY